MHAWVTGLVSLIVKQNNTMMDGIDGDPSRICFCEEACIGGAKSTRNPSQVRNDATEQILEKGNCLAILKLVFARILVGLSMYMCAVTKAKKSLIRMNFCF